MIEQTLDVLDARLGAAPYLAGQQFSLADIVYLPDMDYLMATPLQTAVSYRGNVASWWARSSDRTSWRKATGRRIGRRSGTNHGKGRLSRLSRLTHAEEVR